VQKLLQRVPKVRDGRSIATAIAEEIVQELSGQRSISVSSNRAYLNALMETKRFDEYISTAVDLITVSIRIYTYFLFRRTRRTMWPK
jgi:hypothetical protein